jgi:hypothetical protein
VTGRATFGGFADEAGRYLNLRAGQHGAAGEPRHVQAVSRSLRWFVTVMGRYVSDIAAAPGPAADRSVSAWDRASITAQKALITAGAHLWQDDRGPPGPGGGKTASLLAHRLDAAAVSLTMARDLLHTHDAAGPDDARRARSEWSPVIASAPVSRALLCDVASWARQVASQCAGFALSRGPGMRATEDARRRIYAACQWLWALDTAVQHAQRHDPVTAGDVQLLHAIPVNARSPRRLPDGTEPVTGLCEGTIVSAERVRHAAGILAAEPPWSPQITVSSWRRVAATSMVTSHHCEILLRTLAARMARPGLQRLSTGLLASADAAAQARSRWLHVARAFDQFTTDTQGDPSQAAAEASDLALWTGRLAYADPGWTLARGPSHAARAPANLAPGLEDVPGVVAAVHHGCHALTRLASSDQNQIRAAACAGRLLVPTSSLPEYLHILQPFAAAPPAHTEYLLSVYRDAGQASAEATTQVASVAEVVQAPSQILTAMQLAADTSSNGTPRTTPAPLHDAAATQVLRHLPGPVERTLHDLGVTSPDILRRGTAIDRAGERLIVDAAENQRPLPRQPAVGQPATPIGAADLINRMLASAAPPAFAATRRPAQRQREPPEPEP